MDPAVPAQADSRRQGRLSVTSLLRGASVGGQALRFAAVGVVNTLFSFGVFAAIQQLAHGRVHYEVVLVVSTLIGVLEAYLLQRWLVYQVRGRWWGDLARFSVVYGVVLCINLVVLPLLVEGGHLPVVPTQGAIMVIVAVGTFLTGRYFTFRRSVVATDDRTAVDTSVRTEGHGE